MPVVAIAAKLATFPGCTLFLDDVVRLPNGVEIKVCPGEIVIRSWHGRVFEYLRAGLSYRQIAEHALAISNGTAVRALEGSIVCGPWSAQKPSTEAVAAPFYAGR